MKRSATMAVLAAAGILVSATGAHATTTDLEGTGAAAMPQVETDTPRTSCAAPDAAADVALARTLTPAAHGAAVFAALRGEGLSRGWAADGARLAAQGAAYQARSAPVVRDAAVPTDPVVDLAAYGTAVFTALVEQGVPRGFAASGARYAAQAAAYRAWRGIETVGYGVTVAPVTLRPFDVPEEPNQAWYCLP
ncbi:hypothetical protein [Georgenia yuyongxinii]|uniref:SCP domain-containing protein n=1 Tax=Georgenia yuyongxinii TaxID=2589797 RepID=A0A552WPB6_9MICO|nr:hypothetical protein [Georgenia yuyongxinii]TRW44616.1 hypothetical protein FJ693_13055 [Georgenia yuyongxinii]